MQRTCHFKKRKLFEFPIPVSLLQCTRTRSHQFSSANQCSQGNYYKEKSWRDSTLSRTPSSDTRQIIQRQKNEMREPFSCARTCHPSPAYTCTHKHMNMCSSGAAVRWSALVVGFSCSPARAETRPGLSRAGIAAVVLAAGTEPHAH